MSIFESQGIGLIIISVISSAIVNILVNIGTHMFTEHRIFKNSVKEIINLIDDDLSKFILIADQTIDNYKKSFTIWYVFLIKMNDQRDNFKFENLIYLDKDLREKFLSYYTDSKNLLSNLNYLQERVDKVKSDMDVSISEDEEQWELDKIHKSMESYLIELTIKKLEVENFREELRNRFKFLRESKLPCVECISSIFITEMNLNLLSHTIY